MGESGVRARPSRLKLALAFGAVYLVWGSTYLAIRYAIETLPPLLMAGTRHLVAGGVLYGVTRLRGAPNPDLRGWKSSLLLGGLLLLGGNGAVVWAEQRVPSGLAALLVATEPLWVMLVDWLRPGGVKLNGTVAAGLACGFSGVILLVHPTRLNVGTAVDPWGAAVLVGAALSWAIGSIYAGRVRIPVAPMMFAATQMICGGILLLLTGSAAGEWSRLSIAAVSASSLAAIAYLVVFGSLVGFTAYTWLLGVTSPSSVSTYAYVNPVVAVILGWAFRGEPITLAVVLAATVIVLGVLIIIGHHGKRRHEIELKVAQRERSGAAAGE